MGFGIWPDDVRKWGLALGWMSSESRGDFMTGHLEKYLEGGETRTRWSCNRQHSSHSL
jgi:hypothetical protein